MKSKLVALAEKQEEVEQLLSDLEGDFSKLENIINEISNDPQLKQTLESIITESKFKNIAHSIANIVTSVPSLGDMMSTEKKLQSIQLFVNSMNRSVVTNVDRNGKLINYHPALQKGQMIFVDFAGMGSELNDNHFAIIWDVKDKAETIQVIPVRSDKPHYKEFEYSFPIGRVGHLNRETFVDIRKITTISRKRINNDQLESVPLANDHATVICAPWQRRRIEDAMRVYFGNQPTLLDHLKSIGGNKLPNLLNYPHQKGHLLRPVETIATDSQLLFTEYKLYNDSNQYQIQWKDPSNKLYVSDRNAALEAFAHPAGIVGVTRERERHSLYANLINL